MNIEINLLPDELRPRPLVETNTLLVIVVVVLLAAGCAFLIQAKSSTNSDIASAEERITAINAEIASISSNTEAVALIKSISQLQEAKSNYESFVASRIDWGDALERVKSHIPNGVDISALTQKEDTIRIDGSPPDSGYSAVASYGRALDRDTKLTLAGMPSLNDANYSVVVKVAPGGER